MTYSDVVLIQYEIFNSTPRFNSAPKVACNQTNVSNKQLNHAVSLQSNLRESIAQVALVNTKANHII